MPTSMREEYKSIIRRQRELSREYDNLLDRIIEEGTETEFPPPTMDWPSRTIYIERRCALERDAHGNMNLVTLPGQRSVGLKELRDFTHQAEDLIVVDPYVFSGIRGSATSVAEDFKKAARVGGKSLKRIHVICDTANTTAAIRNEILVLCAKHNVKMTVRHTEAIHDRVWIADRARGLVVGTSFNGLGSRAAFLLPLPDPDLKAVLDYLDSQSLSRAEA